MSAMFNEELVNVVKDFPVLYAKSGSRKLAERDRAWNTVAKRLNRREAECKTRWKSLRDNYYKIIKKRNMGLTCDFLSYLYFGFLDENLDIEHSENNTEKSEIVIPEDNKYVHRHSTSISEKDCNMDPLVPIHLEEDTEHDMSVIMQPKDCNMDPLVPIPLEEDTEHDMSVITQPKDCVMDSLIPIHLEEDTEHDMSVITQPKDCDMDPLVSIHLEEDTEHGMSVITQPKDCDMDPPVSIHLEEDTEHDMSVITQPKDCDMDPPVSIHLEEDTEHGTSVITQPKDCDMDPLVSIHMEEDTEHGITVITIKQPKTHDLPPPLIKIVKQPREEKPVEVKDRITKKSRQDMPIKKRLQSLKKLQNANWTPTHSFFRAMADVIGKFPPENIDNVSKSICTIVTSEELNCIQSVTRVVRP